MSWGGGYPVASPAAGRRGWVSAGLAVLASGLAAVGASGALVVYVSPPAPDGVLVQVRSGWSWALWSTEVTDPVSVADQLVLPLALAVAEPLLRADPVVAQMLDRTAMAPLVGAPIALGATLAFVAAILVLRSGSRPPRAGAGLAALAAGLLVGGAASIGLDAAAEVGDAYEAGSPFQVVEIGPGTWFAAAAALAALVAVVLVARRATVREGPPRGPGVGVVLLPVVAAVAVGGCFAPHVVADGVSAGVPWTSMHPDADDGFVAPLLAPVESAPLLGIPLGVGAALALLAALVRVLPGGPAHLARGRLLGVGACGLVVAVAAHVWLDLGAALRNAGVLVAAGEHVIVAPGLGAWLVLAAGALAVPVIALSLMRA